MGTALNTKAVLVPVSGVTRKTELPSSSDLIVAQEPSDTAAASHPTVLSRPHKKRGEGSMVPPSVCTGIPPEDLSRDAGEATVTPPTETKSTALNTKAVIVPVSG